MVTTRSSFRRTYNVPVGQRSPRNAAGPIASSATGSPRSPESSTPSPSKQLLDELVDRSSRVLKPQSVQAGEKKLPTISAKAADGTWSETSSSSSFDDIARVGQTLQRTSSEERKGFPPAVFSSYKVDNNHVVDSAEIAELILANQRKDDKLRVMHQKLEEIEKGLGSIDEKRLALEDKCAKLETEKMQIQRQLNLREKEISALAKRCASQEEKMKETSQLRSQNRELNEALDSAKGKLVTQQEQQDDLASLQKQLQESELARESLQRQLAKVTREHDAIADTLRECLANVKQLTDEKQQCEEERRRERQRAELELEKQKLAHVKASNDLREAIEEQQARIHQMERILQDSMATNTRLRLERAAMANDQTGEIQRVVEQYEEKLLSLETEVGQSVDFNGTRLRQAAGEDGIGNGSEGFTIVETGDGVFFANGRADVTVK